MQPKNNCKIRGWHGSRPGGSNQSLLCMKMYVSLSPWKCDCFEVWMLLAWLWLQNSCRLIKDFNTSFHNLLYWNSATVNSKLLEVYFSYLVTTSHTNSTGFGSWSMHTLCEPLVFTVFLSVLALLHIRFHLVIQLRMQPAGAHRDVDQLPRFRFDGDNRLEFLSGWPDICAHFGYEKAAEIGT